MDALAVTLPRVYGWLGCRLMELIAVADCPPGTTWTQALGNALDTLTRVFVRGVFSPPDR